MCLLCSLTTFYVRSVKTINQAVFRECNRNFIHQFGKNDFFATLCSPSSHLGEFCFIIVETIEKDYCEAPDIIIYFNILYFGVCWGLAALSSRLAVPHTAPECKALHHTLNTCDCTSGPSAECTGLFTDMQIKSDGLLFIPNTRSGNQFFHIQLVINAELCSVCLLAQFRERSAGWENSKTGIQQDICYCHRPTVQSMPTKWTLCYSLIKCQTDHLPACTTTLDMNSGQSHQDQL